MQKAKKKEGIMSNRKIWCLNVSKKPENLLKISQKFSKNPKKITKVSKQVSKTYC